MVFLRFSKEYKGRGADTDDGRFILNFSADVDKRFVLKAQPWHHKRDGIIFAEFDGKGNPAEVDLGTMAIWAQVRDLPFELKTEDVGSSLGGQIGEVITVSHQNHMIVEKFLRVRVKVPLHEPIKSRVEFTPLGSKEKRYFDVSYEKLPSYCECCGLVGHMSERFCRIPKESRVAVFAKNLSVEAYWKGNTASRRALVYSGYSRKNISKATEGMVVKVTKAVSDLTMKEKGVASSILATGCPVQGRHLLGQ